MEEEFQIIKIFTCDRRKYYIAEPTIRNYSPTLAKMLNRGKNTIFLENINSFEFNFCMEFL